MIKSIAKPINENEPDLLIGNEQAALRIIDNDNDESETRITSPESGWTHEGLEKELSKHNLSWADAYLGETWIGSTEI